MGWEGRGGGQSFSGTKVDEFGKMKVRYLVSFDHRGLQMPSTELLADRNEAPFHASTIEDLDPTLDNGLDTPWFDALEPLTDALPNFLLDLLSGSTHNPCWKLLIPSTC